MPGDPTGGVTLVNNVVLTATLQGAVLGLSMSTGRISGGSRLPAASTVGCRWPAGRSIVPVGFAKPPTIWALRLPRT